MTASAFSSAEKEVDQGADAEADGEAFERVLIAGQQAAIHVDVVTRVFAFDDDVHGSSHSESIPAARRRKKCYLRVSSADAPGLP